MAQDKGLKYVIHDDLISMVQCIYTATVTTEETDISKFIPKAISVGKRVSFYQDWRGSRSYAELSITIHI